MIKPISTSLNASEGINFTKIKINRTVTISAEKLNILAASLAGDLFADDMMRTLYATDASVYREMPLCVTMPRHEEDLLQLIAFANQEGLSLIPRAAGTSLAGQCVGQGIVVDVSKYFTQVLEVNPEQNWVILQPGVVRDELNHLLKPYKLFFGPETSTANRAMVGGMVGNNSCGANSIVYGTTRDHVMEVKAFLSDGSQAHFREVTPDEFHQKRQQSTLEGRLYQQVFDTLASPENAAQIREGFPRKEVHRRNTGYAIDVLLESNIFTPGGPNFNFCKLLAGSEGTLAFTYEIKLHVDPLPPAVGGLICAQFSSLAESLEAVLAAMKHQPFAVELMDKIVMDCTKGHIQYEKYRFFMEGDPQAVLVIEARADNLQEVERQLEVIEREIRSTGLGYAFPRVFGPDMKKVWDLRKAGLGLLSNIPGDAKPVAVIEDTAVVLEELPAYIREFSAMMAGFGQRSVYYAHAGAGELHLRPILDLKKKADRAAFREIASSTADLVKKYRGSLSGEHGDGRVRAEFIPKMVGAANYELLRELKHTWDPKAIFNPGKIVDAPPMDVSLRYDEGQETRQFDTLMDFGDTDGILRAAEKCNGSGDCRKTHLAGGTMCPSYMATRSEKDTTRARANILREVLTRSNDENPFARKEIYEVMDLCLSCKGCASECPSNVNVATLKAEFLYQYYKKHGVPLRSMAIANIARLNRLGGLVPGLTNFVLTNPATSGLLKRSLGVAADRSLPTIHKTTLRKWFSKSGQGFQPEKPIGEVWFFADEFTDLNDVEAGKKALKLLMALGYRVEIPQHVDSGRAQISKGMLKDAQKMAIRNVELLSPIVSAERPIVGLEPSAILGFRDEFPRMVPANMQEKAKALGKNALYIDEFIAREIKAGRITADKFTDEPRKVKLHGHCHQKALSAIGDSVQSLSLPVNYTVEVIPSGCCGMAGSFGYEKEHFALSQQVGEMVLFPAVRAATREEFIAAPGTSCRHQVMDGTGRRAFHPAELLFDALKKS